jgi:hypothetical protein
VKGVNIRRKLVGLIFCHAGPWFSAYMMFVLKYFFPFLYHIHAQFCHKFHKQTDGRNYLQVMTKKHPILGKYKYHNAISCHRGEKLPKNRGAQVGQNLYRFGICVPWDLLSEIDADAKRRYMDRSTWIRDAAMNMLENKNTKGRRSLPKQPSTQLANNEKLPATSNDRSSETRFDVWRSDVA